MNEIERWKFEVRQAMLDYASAEKRGDSAAIAATSTRACELVDELAAKTAARRQAERKARDENANKIKELEQQLAQALAALEAARAINAKMLEICSSARKPVI